MRVRVVRTGGVAGARVVAEVDGDELDVEGRREFERLHAGARPFVRGGAAGPAGGADRFRFEVTVVEGEGALTVRGDEASLPAAVVELARFVVRRGRRPASDAP